MNRGQENSGLSLVDPRSANFQRRVIFVQRTEVCMSTPLFPSCIRFDAFEVDLRAVNSTKAGRKIKLQVCLSGSCPLLERPGEVIPEEFEKGFGPENLWISITASIPHQEASPGSGGRQQEAAFRRDAAKRGYRFTGTVEQAARVRRPRRL